MIPIILILIFITRNNNTNVSFLSLLRKKEDVKWTLKIQLNEIVRAEDHKFRQNYSANWMVVDWDQCYIANVQISQALVLLYTSLLQLTWLVVATSQIDRLFSPHHVLCSPVSLLPVHANHLQMLLLTIFIPYLWFI